MKERGWKIYSPSYKRAGNVNVVNYLGNDVVLCVHEYEAEDYKREYPNNEILVIPNELQGNIARVRNFIRDNDTNEFMVFIDDDVKYIGYSENREKYVLEKEKLLAHIENWADMMFEIETILAGVNLTSDNLSYREFEPILLKSPVLCPFAIIGKDDEVRFDERLFLNEDYDFSLQVLKKYRKILRFQKYHYVIGKFLTTRGGCSVYRSYEKEKQQAELMIKKWGKNVRYDFKKKKFNPTIKVNL